jgi:hypothetical protein
MNPMPTYEQTEIGKTEETGKIGETGKAGADTPPPSALTPDTPAPAPIDTLPMTRYSFVVRGHMANGAEVTIKGVVYARRGLCYQAQTRVLDSVLKEIPTLELGENSVDLRMQKADRCAPPEDLSILGRPNLRSPVASWMERHITPQ